MHALETRLSKEEDDTYTAYMRTSDLSKIGVFDGDWASANLRTGTLFLILTMYSGIRGSR